MLTIQQAAERIGVSDSLLYELCSQGLLPHYRFGRKGKRGKILIEEADLQAFLARCRQDAHVEIPPLRHIAIGHG
jgi:excisionase family DNA binding protein